MIPFFFFTLITLTHKTPTTPPTTHLINQTCKNSSLTDPNINYTFCIKAFHTSPSSRTANLTRLGLISINLLKHNVTNTTHLTKTLLGRHRLNKKTNIALSDCLELYSDSISTLFEAARDFRAKRYDDANVKISGVMDDSSTCEQGFEDLEVYSPLSKHNSDAFQLGAIALSIIDMVRCYF
ncbi:hypothetical protein RND81_08G032800 [Saponaria officinalis]|uniref:Pectinesterase inhibitor domain-containing protein n=1 Tax=Saponaria officinalis TaxID=3572 RepID=A0AAW1J2Y3_SAPOF